MGQSKRINTPLVTIKAMVRVGPWIVEDVVDGAWRKCDRCGTDHKQVWVCTVDADHREVVAKLGGKRTWRVGSKCGPTLEMVSDADWASSTKDAQRVVRLAVCATRALERAGARGIDHLFLPEIVENLALLKEGKLSRHMQRVLRHHVTWLEASIERMLSEPSPAP